MNYDKFNEIIGKIEGVNYVKVISEGDALKEIHILASNLRSPKQIVRDIESSLIAVFDYRIDRKIISIAQIQVDDQQGLGRIKYDGITVEVKGNNIDCTVRLEYEGDEYSTSLTAVKTIANRYRIVAKTTIAVVEIILGQPSIFDIQDVILTKSRDVTFISVLVNIIIEDKEEIMVGSAVITEDANEATVKATLDAINRRVQKSIN